MAKEILYLAKHSNERKKMGEIGKKRVEKYYQKENFLKKYHDLYQTLGGKSYGGDRI